MIIKRKPLNLFDRKEGLENLTLVRHTEGSQRITYLINLVKQLVNRDKDEYLDKTY